jgi:hypothetical protein
VPTPALSDELAQEAVEAVQQHGTVTLAAKALGLARETLNSRVKIAASRGIAPGHFTSGVAPGYRMGKVTVQRNATGDVERTWERQSPDDEARFKALEAAAAALAGDMPRAAPVAFLGPSAPDLATLYTLTDCHVGMLAWHREGGADWDLSIAERTLIGCFEAMVAASPAAELGIVNQLGDFLHFDGLQALTPTSGHILDADSRFEKMVETAIRVLRRVIDLALVKHARVSVVLAEGNHDLASSVWLRKLFAALYENEPRLTVIDSALPYYAIEHGKTLLCFHHGHLKKNDQLPILFAAQFPEAWGRTTKRYAHTGHRHHVEEKEHSGMTVIQHPTLAARDAYAARGGWIAERQATALTYHRLYGKVASNTVCPEMLAA